MNGHVGVTSEFGKGSVFQFKLAFGSVPSSGSATTSVDLKGKSVLVTADNAAQTASLANLLQYWGADVQSARNAQEAETLTEKCRSRGAKFHLGFIDLRMPGIATGGVELSAKIKDAVDSIIVMLPTNHRYGDMERLRKAGIEKYFFKPANPAQLAEAIQRTGPKEIKVHVVSEVGADIRFLKVLVADDSEENRQLIEAYCKDSGFTLELAVDGKQALEKFKKRNYDLVLLDLQMPTMNGYEALSAIRAWEKVKNVIVFRFWR